VYTKRAQRQDKYIPISNRDSNERTDRQTDGQMIDQQHRQAEDRGSERERERVRPARDVCDVCMDVVWYY